MKFRPSRLTLAERLSVERALEAAFASYRARHTAVSPARVRAALRWDRAAAEPSAAWRGVALVGRLAELPLAVGLTALVLTASLGGVVEPPAIVEEANAEATQVRVTARLEGERLLRWFRIGRAAVIADFVDPALGVPRSEAGEDERPPDDPPFGITR